MNEDRERFLVLNGLSFCLFQSEQNEPFQSNALWKGFGPPRAVAFVGLLFRRCTWTSHGFKRIVWRCISRLDFGKKYCKDSPTVREEALYQAIVTGLYAVANDSTTIKALEALKQHTIIYFGGNDSAAMDELRIKELVEQITFVAGKGAFSDEMAALVKELNELKKRVEEKRGRET